MLAHQLPLQSIQQLRLLYHLCPKTLCKEGHFACRPEERRRPWQQQVVVQIAGVSLPLLTLSGACLGTQISLSSDNLPFGSVVLGSQVSHSTLLYQHCAPWMLQRIPSLVHTC